MIVTSKNIMQRMNSNQIRIGSKSRKTSAGFPKPVRKLKVGRNGKIGYSK